MHVRVTGDEHAAIDKAADEAEMTVSSFFRSLLLEGAGVRPILTGDDRLVMAALLEDMRMIASTSIRSQKRSTVAGASIQAS